jgi:heme exporter protein D
LIILLAEVLQRQALLQKVECEKRKEKKKKERKKFSI